MRFQTKPDDGGGLYYYDREAAGAAVRFFPRFLSLVTGPDAGRPFVPLYFWRTLIRDVFGWKHVDDGMRRYREVLALVPRKNTKTTFAAGFELLLLFGDGEQGAQIYNLGVNEAQARIAFDIAARMAIDSPALSKEVIGYKGMIYHPGIDGKIIPLSGRPKGKHGLDPTGVVGDEVHEWSDWDALTFVQQGMAYRSQPLTLLVTTAGKEEGPGFEMYKRALDIYHSRIEDPYTYVMVFSADPDKNKNDDKYWLTEEAWREANPGYGITVNKRFLEVESAKAVGIPRRENHFKRYHLNLFTAADEKWLDVKIWDECGLEDWRKFKDLLAGRRCFVGIDLSSVKDLTSVAYVFPPESDDADGVWFVYTRSFIPGSTIDRRVSEDKQPFDVWERGGAIVIAGKTAIDYDVVLKDIEDHAEVFDIQKVAIDRWNATQFANSLVNAGVVDEVFGFGQGFASMTSPSKALEVMLLTRKLEHGGHPVLRWAAGNVIAAQDAAENIKPDKARSADRIDPIVATIMAIGITDVTLDEIGGSVYDERGIIGI